MESGVTGNVYSLIKSAYENCHFKIKLAGGITHSFESTTGVKQGCSLSPNLSNLFQNDLHNIFQAGCSPVELDGFSFNSVSWANDLILVSKSQQGLQTCLDKLENYCIKWGLQVNASKTKCMVMSLGKTATSNMSFAYGDQELDIVESYKYLGVLVTYNWNVNKMIQDRINKANGAIFMIKRAISSTQNVSIDLALSMFDKRISPVLLFGCPIWGVPLHRFSIKLSVNTIPETDVKSWLVDVLHSISERVTEKHIKSYRVYRKKNEIFVEFNDLSTKSSVVNGFYKKPVPIDLVVCKENHLEYEKVHSNFCKFTLGVSKYSSTTLALGELGRFPIEFKVLRQCVSFWHRMEVGTDNELLQRAYNEGKAIQLPWIKQLSIFLQNNGIGNMEAQMGHLKENYVKKKVKQRLQDQYMQKYNSYVTENLVTGKTLIVAHFCNKQYEKSNYLDVIQRPDIRTVFTRLRIDSNKLADSKFRSYRYKSQLDDNCSDCQVRESVVHRILHCKKGELGKIRSAFYKVINDAVNNNFLSISDKEKINFILNVAPDTADSVRDKVVSAICKFVNDVYKFD